MFQQAILSGLSLVAGFGVQISHASSPSLKESLVTSGTEAAAEVRYYAVPNEVTSGAKGLKAKTKLDTYKGLSLMALSPQEAESLASEIHEKQGSCGGFVDLTPYSVDEKSPRRVFRNFIDTVPAGQTKTTYKMANKPAVDQVLQQADKGEFKKILSDLTSFSDRSARTDNGVKAAAWFKDTFSRWGKDFGRPDVETQQVTTGGWYKQPSVYVRLPGSNPTAAAIVLGGHMDTFPNNKPGADDDGSGAAAVLATYKAVLKSGLRFERDVYFILYAAEEVGLVGSGQVVRDFIKKGIQIHSVMQLDMIGFRSPKDSKELYFVADNTDSALTAFTKRLAQTHLGMKPEMMQDIDCGYACSDHASWHRQGIPAVFPFEATFQNYNKLIHTGSDDMTLIDFDHAFKFVQLATVFVTELGAAIN